MSDILEALERGIRTAAAHKKAQASSSLTVEKVLAVFADACRDINSTIRKNSARRKLAPLKLRLPDQNSGPSDSNDELNVHVGDDEKPLFIIKVKTTGMPLDLQNLKLAGRQIADRLRIILRDAKTGATIAGAFEDPYDIRRALATAYGERVPIKPQCE